MSAILPTVAQALQQGLKAGLDRIDAQWLLLHAAAPAGADRAWLISHDDEQLTPSQTERWASHMARRLAGEPVAYIRGHKAFYGLDLQVDARVLDPRPDTEVLVDWALELLPPGTPACVLDLGTGSGAIALALAHERPQAEVHAVDASADALAVALANAQRLGLPLKGHLGSWLSPVVGQQFDLIVSNPPYIAEHDPHLSALQHEPRQALTSGADGLNDLRHIIAQAPAHLREGAWLLLEHGWDQAEAVQALLAQAGFTQVQSRNDLAGIARCSGARWSAPR